MECVSKRNSLWEGRSPDGVHGACFGDQSGLLGSQCLRLSATANFKWPSLTNNSTYQRMLDSREPQVSVARDVAGPNDDVGLKKNCGKTSIFQTPNSVNLNSRCPLSVSVKNENASHVSKDGFTYKSSNDRKAAIINLSEGSRSSGEMSWCKEKSTWRDPVFSRDIPFSHADHSVEPSLVSEDYRTTPLTSFPTTLYNPRRRTSGIESTAWESRRVSCRDPHPCADCSRPQQQFHRFQNARILDTISNSGDSEACRSSVTQPWSLPPRVFLLALVALVLIPVATNALTGPNVCSKQETYTSLVNVSVVKAYRVRTFVFCLSIPPKCSKYKMNYKTVYKTQSQTKTRTVDVCCSGYTRVPYEDRCIPICSHDCIHGVCIKPDLCRCEAGFSGPSCNISETLQLFSCSY
ncbi:EMI domain [Trinorchestia longiramus]|nr:EMI domain [Trinorchestia longiramus]